MGFFVRKSLGGFGPVRFNLSTSGLGVSAGVRGARIGVGPRGPYVSAGRGGLYYRQKLNSGSSSANTVAVPSSVVTDQPLPQVTTKGTTAPQPGNYGPATALTLLAVILMGSGLSKSSLGLLLTGVVLVLFAVLFAVRRRSKRSWFAAHYKVITKLSAVPAEDQLHKLEASTNSALFHPAAWVYRHEEIYREVLRAALADGITIVEKRWLDGLARGLKIRDQGTLDVDVVRTVLWQLMSDRWVTEEESTQAVQLINSLGLKREDLADELMAMDQFVLGRGAHESGLPIISVGIALQRNEVCHHQTYGEFLEKKILRSYTRGGQRLKEEGLEAVKEGDIYITSKRILLVSSGTSSIPHEKILDIEVDVDERLIEITKDGRQKPIYIQVRDAIYSGMLIELLSKANAVEGHETAS